MELRTQVHFHLWHTRISAETLIFSLPSSSLHSCVLLLPSAIQWRAFFSSSLIASQPHGIQVEKKLQQSVWSELQAAVMRPPGDGHQQYGGFQQLQPLDMPYISSGGWITVQSRHSCPSFHASGFWTILPRSFAAMGLVSFAGPKSLTHTSLFGSFWHGVSPDLPESVESLFAQQAGKSVSSQKPD